MSHKHRFRVVYSETDQMGVARNSVYLDWMSTARIEALRDLGFSYRKLEEDGLLLPVISTDIRFISPARFDDEIEIETYLTHLKKLKIDFFYRFYRVQDEKRVFLAEAKVVVGALAPDFSPRPISDELMNVLKNEIERIEQ